MNFIKPPLGIMPKHIWETKRLNELCEAIFRYLDVRKEIPLEWIEEYNELTKNVHKS